MSRGSRYKDAEKEFITFVHNLCSRAGRWEFFLSIDLDLNVNAFVQFFLWLCRGGDCKDLIEMNDNFDRNKLD